MKLTKTSTGQYTAELDESEVLYLYNGLDNQVTSFVEDAMRRETNIVDRSMMLSSASTCANMMYDIEKNCDIWPDPDKGLPAPVEVDEYTDIRPQAPRR